MWKLVGHRGYPARYPENTLVGFKAAAKAGVDAVELDVHLSRDGVPVVIHDLELERTTDSAGRVNEISYRKLQTVSCHYPSKFAEKFFPQTLTSLEETAAELHDLGVLVFIEIKRKSIPLLGRQKFLEKVLEASSVLGKRRRIISFDLPLLQLMPTLAELPVGWCLEKYREEEYQLALDARPDYLICKPLHIGKQALWKGPWDWFIYGVNSCEQAKYWLERGAVWLESDDPGVIHKLRKEPQLKGEKN